jgi:hypothetical protein
MTHTFIAITTTNAGEGWEVVAYGADKNAVQKKARDIIGDTARPVGTDIYAVTKHKNLRVVSKTEAKQYGVDKDDAEGWYYQSQNAAFVS